MDRLVNLYNQNSEHFLGKDSPWLKNIRESLVSEIEKNGFPNKKKEIWKYSNLNHINNVNYKATNFDNNLKVSKDFNQIDLINGVYYIPRSLLIEDKLFLEKLGKSIDNFKNYFTFNNNYFSNDFIIDINTIFLTEGLSIIINNNQQFELTIKYNNTKDEITSYVRNIIKVNKNSKLTFIENFDNTNSQNNFSNIFNIFWLEEGAKVEHIIIQNSQISSNILYSSLISCFENSEFNQLSFQTGTSSAKFQHTTNLLGSHSSVNHNGIYFGRKKQFMDSKTTVLHHQENCKSKQSYKGILSGESNGVYMSKTIVNPKAQKTDGYQISKGILLNDKCKLNTKPELKIYADDVKCSHGSTIGSIDKDQLFYLQSRGLSKKKSENLLIKAFYQDILEIFQNSKSLTKINSLVDKWLVENHN